MGKRLLWHFRGGRFFFVPMFAVAAFAFFYGVLHSPPITKAQKEILIEVRNACADNIIAAYNLMLSHAPEGAWESTMMLGDYYPGSEEGRDSWDAEAYALIMEAETKAQAILDTVRDGIAVGFVFRQDYDSGLWRMQLSTTLSPSHESVSLVYNPYDEPLLSSAFKPLDDQPYWYYYVIERA